MQLTVQRLELLAFLYVFAIGLGVLAVADKADRVRLCAEK